MPARPTKEDGRAGKLPMAGSTVRGDWSAIGRTVRRFASVAGIRGFGRMIGLPSCVVESDASSQRPCNRRTAASSSSGTTAIRTRPLTRHSTFSHLPIVLPLKMELMVSWLMESCSESSPRTASLIRRALGFPAARCSSRSADRYGSSMTGTSSAPAGTGTDKSPPRSPKIVKFCQIPGSQKEVAANTRQILTNSGRKRLACPDVPDD
jgi:hypothetical protein